MYLIPSQNLYEVDEYTSLKDIKCKAECVPHCQIYWFKDRNCMSTGETLSLGNVTRYMDGVYICNAINEATGATARKNVMLKVTCKYIRPSIELLKINTLKIEVRRLTDLFAIYCSFNTCCNTTMLYSGIFPK